MLRRIPRYRPRLFGTSGAEAAPRFDVVRNYLRFFGPARPKDAAAFLDAPVKEVTAHWPEDAVPVEVTGATGSWSALAGDVEALAAADRPGPAPRSACWGRTTRGSSCGTATPCCRTGLAPGTCGGRSGGRAPSSAAAR